LEETSQRETRPSELILMLEEQGPAGYFAVFEQDEGAGYFFVYKPEKQEVLSQIRIYESGSNLSVKESDIKLMWSSDQTKCGIAVWGRMRGIINIESGKETSAPLEGGLRGISDLESLKGFEKNYLDEYLFLKARQRYWKETLKEQELGIVKVRAEDETPPETNFIVYAIGPHEQAAVFEDDGESGYLYLYSSQEQTVVRYLHIYDRANTLAVARKDVQVMWSKDVTKCGVAIWDKMRGIIDVGSDREGRVWLESRDTPGIGDTQWLEGF
jgi:hypothetical protein